MYKIQFSCLDLILTKSSKHTTLTKKYHTRQQYVSVRTLVKPALTNILRKQFVTKDTHTQRSREIKNTTTLLFYFGRE